MSDTKSLQDLVVYVNTLRQKVDAAGLCSASLLDSNRNSLKSSEFHSNFSALTKKFCEFAEEYRCELDEFDKLLLNNIRLNQLRELQRQNERDRLEILKQIEVISNSNTEASTISNSNKSIAYDSKPEEDIDAKSESVAVLTIPHDLNKKVAPVQTKVAKPVVTKTNTVRQMPLKVKKETAQKTTPIRRNISRQNAKPKNTLRKNAKPNNVKAAKKEKTLKKNADEDNKHQTVMDKPYVYNAHKVQWKFDHKHKSSTVIFIGNLPSNAKEDGVKITEKKIEFWLMQRANVTITQIASVRLNRSARGTYALVRFNPSVSLHKIETFMSKINKENQELYIESKKSKNFRVLSWKKRVFMRFNRNYVKSGDAMWNDVDANHRLIIRNFDILDGNCHYELTHTLLEYGDLYKDIEIRVDSFGDPCCIVIFKYINDAIYFRNSEVGFYGRMLDIKYAKY